VPNDLRNDLKNDLPNGLPSGLHIGFRNDFPGSRSGRQRSTRLKNFITGSPKSKNLFPAEGPGVHFIFLRFKIGKLKNMKVLNYFNTLKIDKMLGIHRGYAFTPAQNRGKEPQKYASNQKKSLNKFGG